MRFLRIAVELAAPELLDDGRCLFTVTTGRFEGPDSAGEVLPGGTDRVQTRPGGVFALDIQMRLRPIQGGMIHAEAS